MSAHLRHRRIAGPAALIGIRAGIAVAGAADRSLRPGSRRPHPGRGKARRADRAPPASRPAAPPGERGASGPRRPAGAAAG